jgi:hypothetical protein
MRIANINGFPYHIVIKQNEKKETLILKCCGTFNYHFGYWDIKEITEISTDLELCPECFNFETRMRLVIENKKLLELSLT